ncbi:MAG TPA: peptidoglycan editing factor PgeF [bacterium]|nr:peptidoglycan editing factor PgeF [bacterium]
MQTKPALSEDVKAVEKGGLVFLSFPRLGPEPALKQVISTRMGGVSSGAFASLNLSAQVGDDPLKVAKNRELFKAGAGYKKTRLVQAKQIHSDIVLKVGPEDLKGLPLSGPWKEGDALITAEKNVTLMILVADCLPALFYDPIHQAIGLAHAGWRGTASHIVAKTLLAMGEAFGTQASEVRVALGPCIGPCCYEVGDDVKGQFEEIFPWAKEVFQRSFGGRFKLDLAEANARQLKDLGVTEENLIRSNLCTVDRSDWFYSHRAEAGSGASTGRLGAFLMLEG